MYYKKRLGSTGRQMVSFYKRCI